MQEQKCLTNLVWQTFKVTVDENYQHLNFHEQYFSSCRKSTIQFLSEWLDSEKIHFKDNSVLKNKTKKKNQTRRLCVNGAVTYNCKLLDHTWVDTGMPCRIWQYIWQNLWFCLYLIWFCWNNILIYSYAKSGYRCFLSLPTKIMYFSLSTSSM